MNKINQKISLGMPVFNGENYIGPAIRSILGQTYQDFELLICDNASHDGTEDICRSYAEKDRRIRYYRNDENLGAAKNFNRTVELADGEYFKWAAHDDMLAPAYLEKCLEVLEKDSSIILAFPKTILVDHLGDPVSKYEVNMKNISSEKAPTRFRDLILINHWGIEIFGLFRKSVLESTGLIESFPGSDRTVMAELALKGRFYEIPEYLFYSRDHSDRSTRNGTIHSRAGWWDTKNTGQTVFPQWRLFYELIKIINRSRLPGKERAVCHSCVLKWLTSNLNWARMVLDIVMVIEPRSWDLALDLKRRFSGKSREALNKSEDDFASGKQNM